MAAQLPVYKEKIWGSEVNPSSVHLLLYVCPQSYLN